MRKYSYANLTAAFTTADTVIRHKMSTGVEPIDRLLEGGMEFGIMYLLYGDRALHDDVLRMAVHAQLPPELGGISTPSIIIDSANMISIERITDHSYRLGLEPEEAMDRIYITRAFNSSQTYDLVMNQLEHLFDQVPARLLIVSGLPNLYLSEDITSEGLQEITHMASRLMTFTLKRNIVTVVTAPASDCNPRLPAGGRALASYAQIHIRIQESRAYFKYTLAKHPSCPVRRASRAKEQRSPFTTFPLSFFLQYEDEE
ncbi:MAG: hypothetical protein ACTSPX_06765 [Candidatus Thorarchaeota archaeon]